MAVKSPIPTLDALPPMSSKARDLMYGVLAWAAGILPIATGIDQLWDEIDWTRPLATASVITLGLWSFGGFKAKGAVSDIKA